MMQPTIYINNLTKTHMKELLFTLFATVATFLSPIKGLLISMVLFTIADTVTGIYTSIKLSGIKSFKSNILFNLAIKSFFYMSSIILAYVIDKYIFGGSILNVAFLGSKAITMCFIWTEVKSLDENSMRLGNRSIWVIFKELLTKAKELKTDVSKILEDDKKESTDGKTE